MIMRARKLLYSPLFEVVPILNTALPIFFNISIVLLNGFTYSRFEAEGS